MNEALELAIKTEKDGIEFYQKTAKSLKDERGKKMFLSLVEDEKRHLDILEKLSCEVDVCITDFDAVDPYNTIKTIFSSGLEKKPSLTPTSDEISAIKVAMDMERRGYELYKNEAKIAKDPDTKAIFERLAFEEQRHFDILQKTAEYFQDSGNWYMWEEHSFPQ